MLQDENLWVPRLTIIYVSTSPGLGVDSLSIRYVPRLRRSKVIYLEGRGKREGKKQVRKSTWSSMRSPLRIGIDRGPADTNANARHGTKGTAKAQRGTGRARRRHYMTMRLPTATHTTRLRHPSTICVLKPAFCASRSLPFGLNGFVRFLTFRFEQHGRRQAHRACSWFGPEPNTDWSRVPVGCRHCWKGWESHRICRTALSGRGGAVWNSVH